MASRVFRQCFVCKRHAKATFEQVMGDLPAERVEPFERCFEVVGVDLCGPFYMSNKGRGSARTEVRLAIFICFRTRAVQIHLVLGEDTNSFTNTLIRFICRAGRPRVIWSDNATNFKGLSGVFGSINWDRVDEWCRTQQRIEWKFIPARSPHFGGLWESSVKSAKKHIYKVMKTVTLHHDAFITLLAMVEAVLNSRPITPLSCNPNDGQPLTPAHFIIGGPLVMLPDPSSSDFPNRKFNLVKTWKQLSEIQRLWLDRWRTEVRQNLQHRQKWHTASKNIRIGKIVFMVDKDKSPYAWTAARITKIFPRRDGRVRAVEVTASPTPDNHNERIFTRAIHELVPVPDDDDEKEE